MTITQDFKIKCPSGEVIIRGSTLALPIETRNRSDVLEDATGGVWVTILDPVKTCRCSSTNRATTGTTGNFWFNWATTTDMPLGTYNYEVIVTSTGNSKLAGTFDMAAQLSPRAS